MIPNEDSFKDGLRRLMNGEQFNRQEARHMMDCIMSGIATTSQISAFLSVLQFRGESSEELTGFVESMRSHAITIEKAEHALDTCGTGGDGLSTFNISTAVAILLSSLNVKVAKHGNRAVSSKSGSADVLEYLGVPVQSSVEDALRALKKNNMCFLFAPLYHASMKHAAGPRKELGFRTVFNILGPLVNPAKSECQLLGVYDFNIARKMAETLKALGTKRSMLVTGEYGLDELSITGPSNVLLVENNQIRELTIAPEDVGLPRGNLKEIQVSTVEESARLIEAIFNGENQSTAYNIVLLNAGAALYVADKVPTVTEGVNMAREAIRAGRVSEQLNRLKGEAREERHA
ncbi:anthranilate phosphoribosyltransferase [Pullulanibacillus pueri]